MFEGLGDAIAAMAGPSIASGSTAGSSVGLLAGSLLSGPAGGAIGSSLGGLAGGTPEGSSSAEAKVTTMLGDWNVSLGGGKSNVFWIAGLVVAIYLLTR
jgi:hypothetical protein